MKKNLVAILVVFKVILLAVGGKPVQAVEEDIVKINPEHNVLVVYSSEHWQMDENIRLLNLSIGHFSNNVEYRNVNYLEESDLKDRTHLFYYGHIKENLDSEVGEIISSFDGPTMAIGYNTDQLGEKYSFLDVGEIQSISKIEYLGAADKTREIEENMVLETKLEPGTEVLVEGEGPEGTFPLIVRNEQNYYQAGNALDKPYSVYFSQVLNTFFEAQPIDKTPAYIRLEDVHPLSDAKRLRAVAEELAKRDIPYMIAVIPVYTHPETGRRYHFEDYREVLDVLRYMQDNGGSVVMHGYTHQFRDSETGEGFEFWDVENEMPIYHGPDEEVEKLTLEDFQNEEEYQAYLTEKKAIEREYIKERLIRGVQELVNYGLYPLAFEAPHYTMSQNGYQVVSEFFSTYVGQIQLSDEKWEIMDTTPYPSQPTILNGMTLLPETIGYVQPDADNGVEEMMANAELYQVTEGGMIGGFYHPYLGVDDFRTLLDEMEQIENIEWIDLKQMDNRVVVDNVNIQSGRGEVESEVNTLGLMTTSFDFVKYHVKEIVIKATWVIAALGVTAVLMFVVFTFYLGVRRRRVERYVPKHSRPTDKG